MRQHLLIRQRLVWAVAGVALSGVFLLLGCENRQGPPEARPVPEVAVITVKTEPVTLTTELPGRTAAYLVADIKPQASGLIQKRLFTEGSDVKVGDVLYQIDPAPFQAAYDSAAANLEAAKKSADRARAALAASAANITRQQATVALAKTDFQRAEDLFKDRAVSATERDHAATNLDVAEATLLAIEAQVESDRAGIAAAEAAIKQAEAALDSARVNLAYTKITAPISGRIGRSSVTEGAVVTAYQPMPLATIQGFDPIYADVPQSTAELARLRKRMEEGHLQDTDSEQKAVKIVMEDSVAYPLPGTLSFRDVTVDPSTGSVVLRILVPNPNGLLLPGMFIRAIVEEGIIEQAVLVPQQAVSRNSKGEPVILVVNASNTAEQRMITVDRDIGNKWLVSSGLVPGDRVIVEGLQKARPGAPVQAVALEEAGETPAPSDSTSQAAQNEN